MHGLDTIIALNERRQALHDRISQRDPYAKKAPLAVAIDAHVDYLRDCGYSPAVLRAASNTAAGFAKNAGYDPVTLLAPEVK